MAPIDEADLGGHTRERTFPVGDSLASPPESVLALSIGRASHDGHKCPRRSRRGLESLCAPDDERNRWPASTTRC